MCLLDYCGWRDDVSSASCAGITLLAVRGSHILNSIFFLSVSWLGRLSGPGPPLVGSSITLN
jgi:hypothetical protein